MSRITRLRYRSKRAQLIQRNLLGTSVPLRRCSIAAQRPVLSHFAEPRSGSALSREKEFIMSALDRIYSDDFVARMRGGEVLLGSFHDLVDPTLIELVGACNFDFVVLELEHGLRSMNDIQSLIRAAEVAGTSPLVRLGDPTENLVARLLDGGATGILVPNVRTADDVETVVNWSYYPPLGTRGTAFRRGPLRVAGEAEVRRREERNKSVAVIAIIENEEAVDNIESILEVDGLVGVMPGPGDYALSLGNVTWDDPRVGAAMNKIREAVGKTDKLLIEFCVNPADTARFVAGGAHGVMIGHDAFLIGDFYKRIAKEMEEGLPAETRSKRGQA